MKRKAITPKTRFEVFKRDGFKCQYCGRSAPDVVLVVDHIDPVASGGDNNIFNLVTSCVECNQGKGARKLSDDSVVSKQRSQLEDANERREQIKMMAAWRQELINMIDSQVGEIEGLFRMHSGMSEVAFSEAGRTKVAGMIKKYGFDLTADALDIAFDAYGKGNNAEAVFNKWQGICRNKKAEELDPDLAELRHAANWFHKYRNYGTYRPAGFILKKLIEARDAGWQVGEIWDVVKTFGTCFQVCSELGVYPY